MRITLVATFRQSRYDVPEFGYRRFARTPRKTEPLFLGFNEDGERVVLSPLAATLWGFILRSSGHQYATDAEIRYATGLTQDELVAALEECTAKGAILVEMSAPPSSLLYGTQPVRRMMTNSPLGVSKRR